MYRSQHGLYAAAAAAILYAVFGTCRQISMGPSSGLAAVAAGAVVASGISDETDVATYVAGITLVSGLLFILLAVLRMGWVARFLPQAVVTGFLFGAAIDVVIGELPKITGTDASGSNSFQELRSWLGALGDTHGRDVGRRCWSPWWWCSGSGSSRRPSPGRWCWWSAGSWRPRLLDLGERGVALVGDIPSGLPALDVPDLALLWDHAGQRQRPPRWPWS